MKRSQSLRNLEYVRYITASHETVPYSGIINQQKLAATQGLQTC
jgi:hypothetical protein